MRPVTYACVVVFVSCLTIAWTGALFEVVIGGIISAIFGAVVGTVFGAGKPFLGWIMVCIILSGLIQGHSLGFASPIWMIILACCMGTTVSALIVRELVKFYKYNSQTKFSFKSVQGAYVGSIIAGVIGSGYWVVVTTAIVAASRIIIKNFAVRVGYYPSILILSLVILVGIGIGIWLRIAGYDYLPAIYTVLVIDLMFIRAVLYSPTN